MGGAQNLYSVAKYTGSAKCARIDVGEGSKTCLKHVSLINNYARVLRRRIDDDACIRLRKACPKAMLINGEPVTRQAIPRCL